MLTYAANTWQLFILVAIRWHCCFVGWYWLGDSLSAWRRNNPTCELSPIISRVLCGPRPKAVAVTSVHPQPLGCPIVTGTLARSLDARAPASTQGKCIRSGQFAFSGKDEQNANLRAALLWRSNICSWFCSWSAALLHQHITCYLRKLICFCTMGFCFVC